MSRSNDRPWTEDEKVYLLTEIMKASQQPLSSQLLELTERFRIEPKWDETPLPTGRTVRSCQTIFDDMRRALRSQYPSQASSSYPLHQATSPFAYQQPSLPQLQPIQPGVRKRPYSEIETTPTSSTRLLQPRPSGSAQSAGGLTLVPHTEFSGSTLQSPSEAGDEPARKKRGRPSKDEIQRREAEAMARGEVYAPKKRAPKKTTESSRGRSLGSGPASPAEGRASQTAESSRIPLQSPSALSQSPSMEKRPKQRQQASGDSMDTSSPPRASEMAPPAPAESTESRSFGSFQHHIPEGTQFSHRSSSVSQSPVPRFQPLLPSGNPPSSENPESTGSAMRSAYHSLYDAQTTSRQ